MYADTHCHMYYPDGKQVNVEDMVKKALLAKVGIIIISGFDEQSNMDAARMAHKYKEVYATVGYHPEELSSLKDNDLVELEKLVNLKKVVAIGEIGLDYHYEDFDKELQKEMFIKQIKLANKCSKPIVVHSRDSIQDTYDILKKYKVDNIKGDLHCYAGSYEMALEFIKLKMSFGIGGVVTYKNSAVLKEVVTKVELSHLLLETDAPYLSPEPFRGKINDSSNIPLIAKKIAEIKGISEEEVMSMTTQNTLDLFDITI